MHALGWSLLPRSYQEPRNHSALPKVSGRAIGIDGSRGSEPRWPRNLVKPSYRKTANRMLKYQTFEKSPNKPPL